MCSMVQDFLVILHQSENLIFIITGPGHTNKNILLRGRESNPRGLGYEPRWATNSLLTIIRVFVPGRRATQPFLKIGEQMDKYCQLWLSSSPYCILTSVKTSHPHFPVLRVFFNLKIEDRL